MTKKPELQHVPRQDNLPVGVASLASRSLQELSRIEVLRGAPVLLAAVSTGRSLRDRMWGFIGIDGGFVVEPIHFGVQPFSCGVAAFSACPLDKRVYASVKDEMFNADFGKWGYLDRSGEITISPSFERVRPFKDGLAGVAVRGRWGFIRENGEFSIEPRFDGVRNFNNGIAIAKLDEKCGFVDPSGTFVIEPHFDCLHEFSEGLALAEVDGKCGFIDQTGAWAINPRFGRLESLDCYHRYNFRFGAAIVELDGRQCLIDRDGAIIFRCDDPEEFVHGFADGIARVIEAGGSNAYYVDASGLRILAEESDEQSDSFAGALDAEEDFSEGLGVVGVSLTMWHHGELFPLWRYADRQGSSRVYGYVDTQGEVKIPPRFKTAAQFSSGLAAVEPNVDEALGYVNRGGVLAIDARFSKAGNFINGLARIRLRESGDKYGFIDQTGTVVIPCRYDFVDNFTDISGK